MNSRILFLSVAALCGVAALVLYITNPEALGMTLLWVGVAALLAVIGLTRKAPSA